VSLKFSDVDAFKLFNDCVTKLLEADRTKSLDLAEVRRLHPRIEPCTHASSHASKSQESSSSCRLGAFPPPPLPVSLLAFLLSWCRVLSLFVLTPVAFLFRYFFACG
jgi:hypothetical protein